jgi:hypothetical protein
MFQSVVTPRARAFVIGFTLSLLLRHLVQYCSAIGEHHNQIRSVTQNVLPHRCRPTRSAARTEPSAGSKVYPSCIRNLEKFHDLPGPQICRGQSPVLTTAKSDLRSMHGNSRWCMRISTWDIFPLQRSLGPCSSCRPTGNFCTFVL